MFARLSVNTTANRTTRLGLDIVEAALLLGVLGDALLRATPWGINVFLWVAALLVALIALLSRWRPARLAEGVGWLAAPIVFFAAAFAFRDSATLQFLDGLGLLLALSIVAWRSSKVQALLKGTFDYVGAGINSGFDALSGAFPLLFCDIKWKTIPRTGWSRRVLAVVRGLAIAVPLLFIFGALFMAADAVFEGIIDKTFRLSSEQVFSHLFLGLLFAWISAGFLRGIMLGRILSSGGKDPSPELCVAGGPASVAGADGGGTVVAGAKRFSLGAIEVGTVLGLLNALFLGFVVIQIRYFFGGAALVHASGGLTYAEYARRGFFELVTVAALVLPLLLVTHWLLRKEDSAAERLFRGLAGALVVLLHIIMASAIGRMRLYQAEYGLTELRLYTTALMGWLALVLIWFVLTVLRGRRERFAGGALIAAFLIVVALHAINPDALIVRVNTAQIRAGHSFDAAYAASLSADGVPALIEAMPVLSPRDRCTIAYRLGQDWPASERGDWRTWNWSRARARSRIGPDLQIVVARDCPPVAPPQIPARAED